MTTQEALFEYTLRLADNALILGHRLSEWCGHGPILEQDIALINIALDQIGQARSLYQMAGEMEGKGRDEDDLAYLRKVHEYRNVLLVEQPNEDFAYTIVRQFLYDAYSQPFFTALKESKNEALAAIATKSLKEVNYHLRYSSEWMIRLGDGTEESHQKMQTALDALWMYSGELLTMNEIDTTLIAEGIAVDMEKIKPIWEEKIAAIVSEATLTLPEGTWMQKGGKEGNHSEHLGFILAELQHLQRAYPGAKW